MGYLKNGCFLSFFSPMRNASAKSFDMKAPFNNNLPTPTATLWLILEIL
jgi:hypothetical protein